MTEEIIEYNGHIFHGTFITKNNSKVQYHTYICEKCNMKNTSIDIYASHGRGFEPEELGIISCDEYIIKKILE